MLPDCPITLACLSLRQPYATQLMVDVVGQQLLHRDCLLYANLRNGNLSPYLLHGFHSG